VTSIANAWILEPGHPVVEIGARFDDAGASLTLRQRRFFADPEAARTEASPRWPVPLVLKVGTAAGVRTERYLLESEESALSLAGARWIFPNGGGAGFYRFALDAGAIDRLAGAIDDLAPEERLALIGNQWALTKAGVSSVAQFVVLLEGFAGETDRAVIDALAERLAWLHVHVVGDETQPAFARLVERLFAPGFARLGWDAATGESADDGMQRATLVGALGRLAKIPAVLAETRVRLERYLADRRTLDPNLVSTVAVLAARDGDTALYERYLSRKRASAADDPEEEERFLFALASFEDPALVARTLDLTFTEDVRPQDRAFVLARLLGGRATRLAAWAFVRDRWDERVLTMDPMLRQYVIRAMATLTPATLAGEVGAFLGAHVTDDTRETTAQAREQLRIDSGAVRRMTPELATALEAGPHA